MEDAECGGNQLPFHEQEALDQVLLIEPGRLESPPVARRFRLHGPSLFVAGLELWHCAQLHWLSGSFRLQALGVVLLVYWILGGLFMTRQPAAGSKDDATYGM